MKPTLQQRVAAETYASDAAKRLRMKAPLIRWSDTREWLGACGESDVIRLSVHVPLDGLEVVVFEECRHAWQYLNDRYRQTDRIAEEDAKQWVWNQLHKLTDVDAWEYSHR